MFGVRVYFLSKHNDDYDTQKKKKNSFELENLRVSFLPDSYYVDRNHTSQPDVVIRLPWTLQ